MSKPKPTPKTVSSKPLFTWFASDAGNRAKMRSMGYSDGRITNWKNRGLPRAEVADVAKIMGTTHDHYLSMAEVAQQQPKKSSMGVVERIGVTPEALEIARAFDRMQPQTQERARELVFLLSIIDRSFPWLRTGKPVSEQYGKFEKWHEENMATQLALEAERIHKIRK